MNMETPGGFPGEIPATHGSIEHQIAQVRAEQAKTDAELEALRETAERELLGSRIEIAVKAFEVAAKQGARGLPVDVLTTSGRDPIAEKLFEATYDRLGLTAARTQAEVKEIIGDEGEVLGHKYALDRDDLSITEVQHDDPVTGGSYRTLYVQRAIDR